MRILDRYILSRFVFNFVSSFVILMFIFIFQTIWLFIDDLAGKGLDIIIIGKFLFYLMPDLTEKVLPLTVLLSSILTFGSFAESYEFAAMKASGISLQRSMLSLIVFVVLLGGVTFFFANTVIPLSQRKIYNLRKNIAKVKPAAVVAEGVFSDFEGMNIKVDEKHGENDRYLKNVIIHIKNKGNVNSTVIKSEKGELISSEESDIIQLVLTNGHYYEDVDSKKNKLKYPHAKASFDTYTMNIEVPELDKEDLEAERDISTDKMKNISRLRKDIDSLKQDNYRIVRAFSKNMESRMGVFAPLDPKDTLKTKTALQKKQDSIRQIKLKLYRANKAKQDSVKESVLYLFPDWQQIQVLSAAKNNTTNILNSVRGKKEEMQKRYKIYNMHILSLHNKFALAFSCIILFFVGAPLGAIIRKGGLGLPMVIAIILFLIYYFIGVFAGNYAKEGNIHPMLGAWLSTLIMLPLGVFLTKRATEDKGMVNFGVVTDFFKNLFKKKDKSGSDDN
ncbi:LptF/LptG family permease [Maribacter sp. MMG018]|uniref:LptF/LptG family permease n=1 Tax=Maribacter sp. MMG018 TaxID=2822688 RepID=UPI001B38302B|nr:LptF/LptG family permease [Maribacter sp. MMG018]MBQ4915432.1 LptF/LptG family permease [Maribacter sp. MMG018]